MLSGKTAFAHRFHHINDICTFKSFCQKIGILHTAYRRFCANSFNFFLPFGFAAYNCYVMSFLHQLNSQRPAYVP